MQWFNHTVRQSYSGTIIQWYSHTVVQSCSDIQFSHWQLLPELVWMTFSLDTHTCTHTHTHTHTTRLINSMQNFSLSFHNNSRNNNNHLRTPSPSLFLHLSVTNTSLKKRSSGVWTIPASHSEINTAEREQCQAFHSAISHHKTIHSSKYLTRGRVAVSKQRLKRLLYCKLIYAIQGQIYKEYKGSYSLYI